MFVDCGVDAWSRQAVVILWNLQVLEAWLKSTAKQVPVQDDTHSC